FPYPFRFFGSEKTLGQIEYLPSISPSVNYSRFENDTRYVDIKTENNNVIVSKPLDLVEKRFLTMGIEGEVLKWQHKNAPIKISLSGLINYNLSEVNMGDETNKNI